LELLGVPPCFFVRDVEKGLAGGRQSTVDSSQLRKSEDRNLTAETPFATALRASREGRRFAEEEGKRKSGMWPFGVLRVNDMSDPSRLWENLKVRPKRSPAVQLRE